MKRFLLYETIISLIFIINIADAHRSDRSPQVPNSVIAGAGDVGEPVGDFVVPDNTTLIKADASAGNMTVTLPDAATVPNVTYKVVKVDTTTNTVTVVGAGGDTIGNSASYVLKKEQDSLTVTSDNANYVSVVPMNAIVDVRLFGVVGDGTTDDEAAIALAQTQAVDRVLRFSEGTYRIATNFSFTEKVMMERGAQLDPDAGATLTFQEDFQAGNYQTFTGDGDALFVAGSVEDVNVAWFKGSEADAANAINAAMDAGVDLETLIPPGVWNILSDITLDENIEVAPGAQIDVDSDDTLTIGSPIDLPNDQVFIDAVDDPTDGTVIFNDGSIETVLPVWFGADGTDGSDDAAALQAAIDSGATNIKSVTIPAGLYNMLSNVDVSTTLLEMDAGAIIDIGVGQTLTIGSGSIESGLEQAFQGAGTVIFDEDAAKNIYPQWWGAVGDGVSDDSAAFIAAIAAAAGREILIVGTDSHYKFSGSVTVPDGVMLNFQQGALISVDNIFTLTINGSLQAGRHQIFDGAGIVSITYPFDGSVFPEWWDDGTSTTDGIQEAIDSTVNPSISLASKNYTVSTTIDIAGGNTTIYGAGVNISRISLANGADVDIIDASVQAFRNEFRNFSIYGNDANNTTGNGITGSYVNLMIKNVQVRECPEYGINIAGSAITLVGCTVHLNTGGGLKMTGNGNMVSGGNYEHSEPGAEPEITITGDGCSVTGAYIENTIAETHTGIKLEGAEGCTITGCYFTGLTYTVQATDGAHHNFIGPMDINYHTGKVWLDATTYGNTIFPNWALESKNTDGDGAIRDDGKNFRYDMLISNGEDIRVSLPSLTRSYPANNVLLYNKPYAERGVDFSNATKRVYSTDRNLKGTKGLATLWSANADEVAGTDNSGSDNKATSMVDTTKNFVSEGVVAGDTIINTTDVSRGIITSITTTSSANDTLNFSGGLALGTDNDFDNGDSYEVILENSLTLASFTADQDIAVYLQANCSFDAILFGARAEIDVDGVIRSISDWSDNSFEYREIQAVGYVPVGATTVKIRLSSKWVDNITSYNEIFIIQAEGKNGGFEEGFTAGLADDWLTSGVITPTQETTNVWSGSNAQKITGDTDAILYQGLSLIANQKYRLRAKVLLEQGSMEIGIGDTTVSDGHILAPEPQVSTEWSDIDIVFEWTGTNRVEFRCAEDATIFYVDNAAIYETIEGHAMPEATFTDRVIERMITFDADDATPSVKLGNVFKTANANPTTITMFDDGYEGQTIKVIINDANTTIDFTGTNLKGNGNVDWTTASGDHLWAVFDGTDWFCDVTGPNIQLANDSLKVQSAVDSTTGFQVLDADGGTSVFNIDTVNERVGIGTDVPVFALDVIGSIQITADIRGVAPFSIRHQGSAGGNLTIADEPEFSFNTNGALSLSASSGIETFVRLRPVINQSGTAGYTALLVNPIETSIGSGITALADLQLGGTSRFIVLSSGNVGINTTGTDRKLDVLDASNPQVRMTHTDGTVYTDFQTDANGDLQITPSDNEVIIAGVLEVADGSVAAPSYGFSGQSSVGIRRSASNTLQFIVAGGERLRIESGNVFIGDIATTNLVTGGGTKHDGFVIRAAAEAQTTDATADVTLDTLALEDENVYTVQAFVAASQSDGTDEAGYILSCMARRTGGGGATVGTTVSQMTDESNAALDATFIVSGNNLILAVTGIAAETWEWGATVRYINMSN